ncbi:MAG: type II secretion system F family protein [Cytophagales bacterium]|nr:type II secretion system F family protein [Cytophagales bacterium]
MPVFAWKAINTEGKTQSGKSQAVDQTALALSLEQSGQLLLKATIVRPGLTLFAAKTGREQLLNFSFQLSMMLRAGVTILDALRDVSEGEGNSAMREVIGKLIDALSSGKTLSQAMLTQPKVFDSVYVNLIQAGEQTGQFIEVLEDLTETIKWQYEMASQTRKALTYPIIVTVVITGVLLFMLGYVVPQITQLLKTMQIELPWQTRALMWMSDVILNHWLLLALFVGGGMAFIAFVAKVPGKMRTHTDNLKLKLPVLGKVLSRIALARFSYVLAILYAAGVTVTDALKVVEKAVGNQAMAEAIKSARIQITKGKSLSAAFSGSALFPPMVVSMLRVGEATGSLDKSLKNVSYMYTREARDAVENLQASLQPIMTVILGGIMALIMVFTLGPLYESVIGGGKI